MHKYFYTMYIRKGRFRFLFQKNFISDFWLHKIPYKWDIVIQFFMYTEENRPIWVTFLELWFFVKYCPILLTQCWKIDFRVEQFSYVNIKKNILLHLILLLFQTNKNLCLAICEYRPCLMYIWWIIITWWCLVWGIYSSYN